MEWYEYIISSCITTILIGFVTEYCLENHKTELNKELSVFETRLKNSMFYFSRQFEALSALYELFYRLLPTRTFPGMDWGDACEMIACNFEHLESDDFVDWVYKNHVSKQDTDRRELPGIRDLKNGPKAPEEIARRVASEFGVGQTELCQKRAKCRDARLIFLELCRIYLSRNMSLAQMGKRLGAISASAFSRNKVRLREKIEKDPYLRFRFEKIKNALSRFSK